MTKPALRAQDRSKQPKFREKMTCAARNALFTYISLATGLQPTRRLRVGRVLVATLMAGLLFGTLALSAAPQLHRLLHQDANTLNHHCLVTQLNEHAVLVGCAAILAPAPPPISHSLICSAYFQYLPTSDHRLTPSRGPPSASSITIVG